MSERDILNPTVVWEDDIEDSMTPDFGFARKRPYTRSQAKPVGGPPFTRDLGNTGHAFTLSWMNRTYKCVQRLKKWQEQFEDDFFTLIDWDGGGRHYVGRFASEVQAVEVANNCWNVQNLAFEEIPTVPMLKYPNDWPGDGIILYPQNGFTDQKLAISGAWTATARTFSNLPRTTYDNSGANAGDWAQYEYRGYGFRLHTLCGPTFGAAEIWVDSVYVGTANCYSAAGPVPQIVCAIESMSLDLHRVKVIAPGAGAVVAASTSPLNAKWTRPGQAPMATGASVPATTALSWFALEVMR